jgi:hypothetical protein
VPWRPTNNPTGADGSILEGLLNAVRKDRCAYFIAFYQDFYKTDEFLGTRLSDDEVADLVLLLASDRAGNVTDFVLDGGLVKTL